MNTKLPDRQRWLLLIAGAGLLLLLIDRVLVTPLTALWRAHAAEIVRLQRSVDNGASLMARAGQMESLWAQMQAGALPQSPAQAEQDLIAAFDRWGRSSGVELGSIRPQWKRGATDLSSLLECRVDATGSFASLSRFLFEVEKSPLALRLESVELTSRDAAGQRVGLSLLVTGLRLAPPEGKS